MWFDPDKVEKIIYNLISNAFKFTKSAGSIEIRLSAPNIEISENINRMPAIPMCEINVQDTGIGIAADQLGKIFQPFFQIPSEGNVTDRGTGIGLTLTKELVDLHQGYITVESQIEVGSCFKVLLPANLIPQAGVQEVELIEESLYPVLPRTESKPVENKLPDENEEGALVLIVDDDHDFCLYLKDELSSDYRVIIAGSGEAALDKSGEYLPDLIISDVRMPKMDGFSLCRSLKSNEKTNHIPVILLTSQTREDQQLDGFDCGADDYIIKPFDVILLRKRMANLLDSRKKLKERFSHEIYLQPSNVTITSEDERFLLNVFQVVEAHLEDSEYTISQLGRDVGLSRVQLYRKIKTLADITPNDLLKNFRLKRAAQLLRESHLTVFEIAYRVGYKDPSYFCKCFKQNYHRSPTEYARETAKSEKEIHTGVNQI
jgi:DNA-binding response OmpR family regulator